MTRAVMFLACLGLGGCLPVGDSDAPRLWELPRPEHEGPPVRVFLPVDLRTPRVVAADPSGAPVARDFDRWALPLHESMARIISEQLVIGLPVRRATVNFQTLRVNTKGDGELAATYRVILWSFVGGPDIERDGRIVASLGGGEGEGLEDAVTAYAWAARTVAKRIRSDYEQAAEAEVAKPASAVTVPGK
jgi:hypothetical protein